MKDKENLTYEFGAVDQHRPLGSHIHGLSFNQVETDLFGIVVCLQVVFTAQIFKNGERLRQFHVSIDVVRKL